MEYQVSKPYPKVQVEKPNLEYAQILSHPYAGDVSEDSAIHLYLYQYLVSRECYLEYADIIHHIAIVEMHHLQLLGEAISLLGMKPAFQTFDPQTLSSIPFTTAYIDYSVELKDMLKIDIESEEAAIRHYQLYLNLIQDVYIQNLIARIIEDEQLHLSIFKNFYSHL